MKRGDSGAADIAATPMSVLLDRVRRAYWREKGEADRPPAPAMGEHGAAHATGPDHAYRADRDGDYGSWGRQREEQARLAAEAQQAWEEKAKAEAEAWTEREAGKGGEDGAAGKGVEPL